MTTPDREQRLAEIAERASKATQGPWTRLKTQAIAYGKVLDNRIGYSRIAKGGGEVIRDTSDMNRFDVQFIAHSRADVPWLLEEIERLQAKWERDANQNEMHQSRMAEEIERFKLLQSAFDQRVGEGIVEKGVWVESEEYGGKCAQLNAFKLLCGEMVSIMEHTVSMPQECWEWREKAMMAFKDAKGERDE